MQSVALELTKVNGCNFNIIRKFCSKEWREADARQLDAKNSLAIKYLNMVYKNFLDFSNPSSEHLCLKGAGNLKNALEDDWMNIMSVSLIFLVEASQEKRENIFSIKSSLSCRVLCSSFNEEILSNSDQIAR